MDFYKMVKIVIEQNVDITVLLTFSHYRGNNCSRGTNADSVHSTVATFVKPYVKHREVLTIV